MEQTQSRLNSNEVAAHAADKLADFMVVAVSDKQDAFWVYKDTGTMLTHPKYVPRATLLAWAQQGGNFMCAEVLTTPAKHQDVRQTVLGGYVKVMPTKLDIQV